MDWWNLLWVGCGVLLNALVLGFWKPWAGAYSGEKGKNVARKEDLNAIVAEIRAVTITQKEIEAKISGDVWHEQMLFTQRRDIYLELIRILQDISNGANNLSYIIGTLKRSAQNEVEQTSMREHFQKQLKELTTARSNFMTASASAVIFCGQQCYLAIRKFSVVVPPGPDLMYDTSIEWADEQARTSNELRLDLVSAAREELGVTKKPPITL